MNEDQFACLAHHRKVRAVLLEHASDVASVPALARLAAQYLGQLALLDDPAGKQPPPLPGAALAGSTAGAALTARLVKAANALYLLYKTENNLAEAAKLPRRAGDYLALPAQELAATTLDLSTRAAARAPDLLAYNLPAADVAALATDAASLATQEARPQPSLDSQAQPAATVAALGALDSFLQDDLLAGIELLSDTRPGTYAALREASEEGPHHREDTAEKLLPADSQPITQPSAGPFARAAAHGGIKSVYLTIPGADVQLDLTVSTRCLWDFVLPSFPATVHERYASQDDEPTRTAPVGRAADLLGKPCTWSLRLTNEDPEHTLPYQVLVRLLQGPTEIYRYENEGAIDPALKIPDAFLGETLVYSR